MLWNHLLFLLMHSHHSYIHFSLQTTNKHTRKSSINMKCSLSGLTMCLCICCCCCCGCLCSYLKCTDPYPMLLQIHTNKCNSMRLFCISILILRLHFICISGWWSFWMELGDFKIYKQFTIYFSIHTSQFNLIHHQMHHNSELDHIERMKKAILSGIILPSCI